MHVSTLSLDSTRLPTLKNSAHCVCPDTSQAQPSLLAYLLSINLSHPVLYRLLYDYFPLIPWWMEWFDGDNDYGFRSRDIFVSPVCVRTVYIFTTSRCAPPHAPSFCSAFTSSKAQMTRATWGYWLFNYVIKCFILITPVPASLPPCSPA